MIIQVITNLYPLPWEPDRAAFNRQQFENLASHHDVEVIVLVPWISALKHFSSLGSARINNVGIRYLPYFYLPRLGRRLTALFVLFSLPGRLFAFKRRRPDCLLLSWAFPDAVAGMVLSRLLKIPAVIKVHGSDINMHCRHRARARQVAWAVRHASAVMSVSQDLKNKIVELGTPESKIHVIYNGVDRRIFYPRDRQDVRTQLGVQSDRKIILFIGNLKKSKGCVDLLNAWLPIAKADALVDLYFIGSGPERAAMALQAEKHDLQQRVVLLGSMSHRKLGDWINAADLVALPSHDEGVPNVLLEAMCCGVPVVASRVGGIPEVVPANAGILIEPHDVASLSRALVDALAHSWSSEDIVENMKDFTWENNTKQSQSLLREISNLSPLAS